MYNLLENAVKYSHQNGEVDFTVGFDARERTITCALKDNGIGIPEEEQPRLFDEFYRAPNARIYDKSGTGFGMAIVKRVLDLCGGTILVKSGENQGTQITFTLPLVKTSDRPIVIHKKKSPHRKIVVIGGVSAGPKAASRARRLDPDAEITIFEKEHSMAYAGCALPYYISGWIKSRRDLYHAISGSYDVADDFRKIKGIDIKNLSEVVSIDRKNRSIRYQDLITEHEYTELYDVLILATGSVPIVPDIPGIELQNIFKLHGIGDADRIKFALANHVARDIVIIGGGIIGCEIADALTVSGARVTIVEQDNQILPFLDPEMALLVEQHMVYRGIRILKGETVKALKGRQAVQSIQLSRSKIPAELVILAMGVHPNVELAREAGLHIGTTGAIAVNQYLQTSDPLIYAVGDCAETVHVLLDKPYYLPLGSIANRQGRIAGANATGKEYSSFGSVTGTMIFTVFGYHVAKTGLNEQDVVDMGCDFVSCMVPHYDKEHFIPEAEIINIKMIACRKTRRLLGVQITGRGDVSKRIDVAAIVISKKGTIDDLLSVDLGYAPTYSNALGAIIVTANVLDNKINGRFRGITSIEMHELMHNSRGKFTFLDVRSAVEYDEERIEATISIPLQNLQARIDELPRNRGFILICDTGAKAYQASLILQANDFKDVRVLEGGLKMWPFQVAHD
jgi:NADPH-dependent 2,4-dienoyl-CoA reductase/sulfur reductase-like enzyme/rhodanese-related sulfurtransferase